MSAHTDNERSEAAVDVPRLVRVILNNPNGYNNYQGTVKRVFMWGNQEWADIEWDVPIHPCTTPMETKHLIPANTENTHATK